MSARTIELDFKAENMKIDAGLAARHARVLSKVEQLGDDENGSNFTSKKRSHDSELSKMLSAGSQSRAGEKKSNKRQSKRADTVGSPQLNEKDYKNKNVNYIELPRDVMLDKELKNPRATTDSHLPFRASELDLFEIK